MSTKPFTFHILRFDPAVDAEPHYQDYSLDVPEGMSVLEALLRIQAEQDGTLALRYACRGAVCGSCAMRINGREDLSCRVQVHTIGQKTLTVFEGDERKAVEQKPPDPTVVTVEPLRNLPVLKDLVVDLDTFLGKDEAVEPWLQPATPPPSREYIVKPEQLPEALPYTRCILCACCHSVCPAEHDDPRYLGPAALGQHYRFLTDPRDGAAAKRIHLTDSEEGVWGCYMVWNCVKICPKGVPPTEGIAKTRVRIRKEQKAREKGQGARDEGTRGRGDRVTRGQGKNRAATVRERPGQGDRVTG